MENTVVITIDNEDFILMTNGKLDVNRLLDLPLSELEQVINDLDMLDIEGLEDLDIQEIIFHLCRRILQQKAYIADLEDELIDIGGGIPACWIK